MKKTLVACALLTASLAVGCSDSGEQFVILQNQVPQSGCVISTDRGIYRGEGWLDVSLVSADTPFAYQLYPLMQNDLPVVGGQGAGEPNRLFVRAFRVRVDVPRDPKGQAVGVPQKIADLFDELHASDPIDPLVVFQEPWSGSVDPGGLIAGAVTGVPGELARRIRATGALDAISFTNLVVKVKAVADRSIGSIESREFTYPVRVCSRCLMSSLKPCPMAPTNKGNVCNIAQDEPVDCCTEGTALVCPAREDR
jgi:hypothetical protein